MKKIFKALHLFGALASIAIVVMACDKEFNSIESDVLGKDNANFNTAKRNIEVLAYNKKLDAVQINGFNSNLLGVYKDPLYGQTTASIVTQILPTSFNPDFGTNPIIDSVMLNIPYFSRTNGVVDGVTQYVMEERDSLYSYGDGTIKLSIYRNTYFLRDFNPNAEEAAAQMYYSFAENTPNSTEHFALTESGSINFDSFKEPDAIYSQDYLPSNLAIEIKNGENTSYSAPALRIPLDIDFWKTTIFDKEDGAELSNANNFRNYFRGLYIKAEAKDSNNGHLQLLNFGSSNATITIYYTKESTSDSSVRNNTTYTFNFSGIRLNTFINEFTTPLEDGDVDNGDEILNLKGMSGSMAVVDLFPGEKNADGVPLALENLRTDFTDSDGDPIRLINEARLIIYENDALTDAEHKYDRLYAYDIKNNTALVDYNFDVTTNTTTPYNSKVIHLGQRDTLGETDRGYKIRITEHMRRLLFNDSLNTKIGLVISNNVNTITNADLLNSNDDVDEVPTATQLTARGTKLYGSSATNQNKKIRLEIFYSDPNN